MFSPRSSRRCSALTAGALFLALLFLTATDGPQRLFAQAPPQQLIAGRNVNMVSGTEWPNGDPFLQRQNEPSLAASTRNPQHLLGGSNDYRTIDLPGLPDGGETGDAWLGLYKSFDGGDRWQSTLVPGYPQDNSPIGLTSPLKGYQAGADPVVRAGTNGLFYYSGIVFDRGSPNRSRVFVARFIDNNNKESGDPIAYLGTSVIASDAGTTGAFIDKPWMAVDVPRDGARTCQVAAPGAAATQSISAGNVYVAYSVIEGSGPDIQSTIMFASSSDCGVKWTRPVAISNPTDRVNQGATIAIDPESGDVFVAWRQFGLSAGAPDSISITSAAHGGKGFKKAEKIRQFMAHHTPEQIEKWLAHKRRQPKNKLNADTPVVTDVAQLDSFDQPTLEDRFRTNAYPTMAVDDQGRVYLAWTERGFSDFNGDTDQGDARIVMATSLGGDIWGAPKAVDPPDIGGSPAPGHQFMPSLVFAGGKLTLAYYDLRNDVSGVFGQYVDEGDALVYSAPKRRHTIDIRATQADPGEEPAFAPSVQVSQYIFGSRRGSNVIEQLQFNPPNLPLFQLGTVPFIGDYLDLAPSPAFVQNAQGAWTHNTAPSGSPVFHVAWTDNRDVRPPTDGDWTKYTPPTNPFSGIACDPRFTASRNQNVYTSKLTMGLLAGSPGNAKPLDPALPRGFVVFAQNTTNTAKTFRFTITGQPPGGRAEFSQLASSALLLQVDARVPARSSVSRTVYVTSSDPNARVPVSIVEVSGPNGSPIAGGLQGTVILNPDIENPDIENPDIENPDIENPDIANAEVYNPDIANPDIANPDIANPDIANPDIENPDIENPDIANPDIANPDIENPDIENPDIENPDIENPDIENPDIANGSLTDVTWKVTNTGNTAATFDVDLFFKNNPVPDGIKTQLILYRTYKTPVSSASTNCQLKIQTQNILVANIVNPVFNAPETELQPDPANSDATNATMWIEPGGSAKITLRVIDKNPNDGVTFDPVDDVKPVVTSEAYNTTDIENGTPPETPPPTTEPPSASVPFLEFAQPPVGALAGSSMPAFSVQFWALAGTAGGAGVPVTIALASNPGGGTLVGPTTVLTNSVGVATFTGVAISSPGVGYRISASAASANAIPVISGTLSTGKLQAMVTVGTATVTYDGNPHQVPVSVIPAGLALLVTYDGGGPPTDVGPGTYTVAAAVDDARYEGFGTGSLTINKATPVITWAAPAPILPGVALDATQLNATANVPGTFVYTPAQGAVLDAGLGQTLSVAFTATDTDNYNTATASVTIDVTSSADGGSFNIPGTAGGTVNVNNPGAGGTAPVAVARVRPGDQITISATGTYEWAAGQSFGPAGRIPQSSGANTEVLAVNLPELALVARIAGGSWQYVGPGPTTLTAWSAGQVELAVNDNYYGDNSGALQAQVSVLRGAATLPLSVATAATAGTGGSPFGPIGCAPGWNMTSLTVGYNYPGPWYYAVARAEVVCTDPNTLATTVAGTVEAPAGLFTPANGAAIVNTALACGPGKVITGLTGTTGASGASGVVTQLGVICSDLDGTNPVTVGPAGVNAEAPFTLSCPAGMGAIGIRGRNGWYVDQIQLECAAPGMVDLGALTLVGGAAFTQGQIGQAIGFGPNTDSPNQYALVASQPALVMTNAVTMSAWIYPTGPGHYSTTFSSPNSPDPVGEGGMILNKEDSYEFARFADGSIRWAFNTGSPGWTWINSLAVAPEGQWSHVVVTYDATAGVATTYLNGAEVNTYPVTGQIGDVGKQLRIGGRQNTDANSIFQNFEGLIDDVGLFNRAITAAEVQQLFVRR